MNQLLHVLLAVALVDCSADGQYYHYLEIGLSDFDTLIEKQPPDQKGLSVEALPVYVNNLKQRYADSHPNTKLINAAVIPADTQQRRVKAFFVPLENISALQLPRNFRGTNRIGEPHPFTASHLKKYGLSHLLVSRWVPAISLRKLLEIHQACRIGLLKLDVEGLDLPLLSAYVQYLRLHPNCWADCLEFEVNPLLTTASALADVTDLLGSLGYFTVRDDRTKPWPELHFTIYSVYWPRFDPRNVWRQTQQTQSHLIPEAPKVLHLLMPCWNHLCEDALEQRRRQWSELLPEWQIEAWTRQKLKGHWDMLKSKRDARLKVKYALLSQFGGAVVDWRLNPQALRDVPMATTRTRFLCLNPGPQLQNLNGMVLVARPFDPFLEVMHRGYDLFIRRELWDQRMAVRNGMLKAVNSSMADLELTFMKYQWDDREPGAELPCLHFSTAVL